MSELAIYEQILISWHQFWILNMSKPLSLIWLDLSFDIHIHRQVL